MNNQATPATSPSETRQRARRIMQIARTVALGLVFVAANTLILTFQLLPSNRVSLQAGQVAPEDIRAPRPKTYISEVETGVLRNAAAAGVPDVYDPPNARVGRQQVLYARQVMDFVNTVRHDTLATNTQRADALNAVTALDLDPANVDTLLTISDNQFDEVSDEISSVLAEVMSGEVREGRLDEVREGLLLLVSVDLPEEYGPLVTDVVDDLVLPNSTFNAELTERARQTARDAVEPVEQTFAQGEVVVRAGEIVTESDVEALERLGLLQSRVDWLDIASRLLAVLISTVTLILYLIRFHPGLLSEPGNQVLGGGLFVLSLLGARLLVAEGAITPYLFPAAALSLLLTTLFSPEVAIINAVVLAWLTGFIAQHSLELTTFTAVGGIMAAISLRRAERLNRFFLAGLFVGISQAVVVLAFRLGDQGTDPLGMLQLTAAALLNGLVSAGFALAGLFVVGPLFRRTTALMLIELERPDHPLSLRLQREATGTYQHSLQVRNLAEAAADQIGANSLLTRVGALYHDIGKVLRPAFFIENRVEGTPDPHAALDPRSSADIIIRHVKDGLDLARSHHLPERLRDFIAEHHGTSLLRPFYQAALDAAGGDESKVDEEAFRYEGPRPQSRETAVLMLADACESAVRANQPRSVEEIDAIVTRIIEQRLDTGQLDESELTLTDLQTIRHTFVGRLKGIYHPRIRYPDDKPPVEPEAQPQPSDA